MVIVGGKALLLLTEAEERRPKIHKVTVTEFKKLFRTKSYSQIYTISHIKSEEGPLAEALNETGWEERRILRECSDVFHDELPKPLPPLCTVDRVIETSPNAKLPHRLIFQLSSVVLQKTKEYITDLFQREKIRMSKSLTLHLCYFSNKKKTAWSDLLQSAQQINETQQFSYPHD